MTDTQSDPVIDSQIANKHARTIKGVKQTVKYIKMHNNTLLNNVGAHFIMNLHEAGVTEGGIGVLPNFIKRFNDDLHNIELTDEEQECLKEAGKQTTLSKGFRKTPLFENLIGNVMGRRIFLHLAIGGAAGLATAGLPLVGPVLSSISDKLPNLSGEEALACDKIFVTAMEKINSLPEAERTDASMVEFVNKELCKSLANIDKQQALDLDEENVDTLNITKAVVTAMVIGFTASATVRGVPMVVSQVFKDTSAQAIARISQMEDFCNNRLERDIDGSNQGILKRNNALLTVLLDELRSVEEIAEGGDLSPEVRSARILAAISCFGTNLNKMSQEELLPSVPESKSAQANPSEEPATKENAEDLSEEGKSRRSFMGLIS